MHASPLIDSATRVAGSIAAAALTDAELVDAIRTVGELRRLADAAGVRLTAELEARSAAAGAEALDRVRGHVGVPSLVEAEAGITLSEARSWSTVADATALRTSLTGERLPARRPLVADRVADGTLAIGAAARIVRALEDAARRIPADEVDGYERVLVECAPRLTDRELRSACRRIAALVDPDGAEPREEELRRRSTLNIRQQDDGLTRVSGLLHPEAAGYLIAAIDARTAPRRIPSFTDPVSDEPAESPDEADRLPLARRRAEALAAIARDSLAHDPGALAGTAVTLLVTLTADQLTSGLGTASIAGVDEPISAATARRMAAGAEIIPVVLGTDSEVLDLGRAHRLASPAQRRALAKRDGGCLWSGCSAPPGWCEVAHLLSWFLGGRTDLANLALLCPFHHRLFDRDGWALKWVDAVPWLIPPPHVDPDRTPRRAGRARILA